MLGLDDLLNEFLRETTENIATVRCAAAELRRDPADWRALDTVFRTLHGIKGACGFMRLSELQAEVHAAEELLAKVRARRRAPGADLADLVEGSLAHIAEAVAELGAARGGAAEPPAGPEPAQRQSVAEVCRALAPMIERLAVELGKSVRLVVRGGQFEADRAVIAVVKAALVHILRNALDHGLEPGETRARFGKPRQGTIRVTAYDGDGRLFVDVADDGRGLDFSAIRERALALGLVGPDEAAAMSRDELARLTLAPGLSTAGRVTALSGRGVGLDAVRAGTESLGGTVEVSEASDGGTKVRIALPLERPAVPAEGAEAGAEDAGRRRGRILLVDENPMFQNVLAPQLRAAGYEVTAVRKMDRLLSLYRNGASFDLILSDLEPPAGSKTPAADGAQTPTSPRQAPVIALASHEGGGADADSEGAPARDDKPGGAAKGGRR